MMTEHTISFRVRYSECDPGGIAHHGSYLAWFEMGRTELLRESGVRYRDLEAEGVFIVVVKLEVNYRRPARYDEVLALTTRLAGTSHAKIEHEYELRTRSDEVIATARTTLACVDAAGKVRPVPEALRQRATHDHSD